MATFLTSTPMKKDKEISRLKAENHSLAEELTQCQGDKEFVWSLWKRLQVANPDVTQAVSMVAHREKEKAEAKDQKVLEILTAKDAKIDELQKYITEQANELASTIKKKHDFEERVSRLERERAELQQKVEELNIGRHENASRDAIRELDKQNLELKQELNKKTVELDRLQRDKGDMSVIRDSHKERIKQLEEQITESETSKDEYDDMKKLLKKYENQLSSQQRDIQAKNRELEQVRKELSDLWGTHRETADHANQQADLIRQLQALQNDTHKMVKNTESAYSMETMTLHNVNQSLKTTQDNLARQIRKQSKTIDELQAMIHDLQTQLEDRVQSGDVYERSDNVNDVLRSLQRDVHLLKSGHRSSRDRSASPGYNSQHHSPLPSPNRGSRSSKDKGDKARSRSLSPHKETDLRVVQRRLQLTEKKLSDTQLLLHLKAKELGDLRTTHARRLERLKSLQSNHKLLKKQVALMDEEINGTRKKKKKVARSEPRSLQREDSDAVWNELTYFRKQAGKLQIENMNLAEECDTLKVKLSQLEANNHEMKACLDQERQELQFMVEQEQERERSSTPVPAADHEAAVAEQRQQLEHYRRQIERLKRQLNQVSGEQRRIEEHSQQIIAEKRSLKAEINALRQQDSAYRITIADHKQEIARLQLELTKQKKKKSKSPTSVGKKYQQTLNKSIREMSGVFDGFNKDGWEDVPESDKEISGTTATTDTGCSLGEAIAHQAHNSLHGAEHSFDDITPSTPTNISNILTDREVDAEEDHYRRLSRRDEQEPVHHRSIALSPIRFERASRSVGVSPIHQYSPTSRSPHVVSKKSGFTPTTNSKLVSTLRQRISTLQTQVITLKHSKDLAVRGNAELKNTVSQLTSDLQSANTKLQTHRLNVQRVASDLDRVRADKEALQHQLEDCSVENTAVVHSEQDFGNLQSRLKNASNEVSKQLVQIKELKSEISTQQEKITQLQDRNKVLERDNSQKRLLVEDMRSKMKMVNDNTQSDAKVIDEMEAKWRSVSETSQRYKTQVDSFKVRLAAVTREKYDNEEKVLKLSDEIEKKSRQMSELQAKSRSLQSTVAVVEKTAKQQLTSLANQSEAAIDMAQDKLLQAGGKLQEYSKFVKVLAHSLLNSLQQTRQFLHGQKIKQEQGKKDMESEPSARKFQSVACDILNISESDLEDILSAENAHLEQLSEGQKIEDLKKDRKWAKRWEKAIQTQEDFSVTLVEIFMEKIEERCHLAAQLAIV